MTVHFQMGVLAATLGTLIALGQGMVHGAENHHPPEHQELHEKFYSHWNMPDNRDASGARVASCCNNEDCFPTQFKREHGQWYVRVRDGSHFVPVPASKLESNYPDAEDSPDGQGHACMIGDYIFCAVLGSGM